MIQHAHLTTWQTYAPWPKRSQVEQDLRLSRGVAAIFADPVLGEQLAMRGGTVLHKAHLAPAARYSEDIDLVLVKAIPKRTTGKVQISEHLGSICSERRCRDRCTCIALPPLLSYDCFMKSLTIRLPDDLADQLERESRERGMSKSDLVRERLSRDAPPPPVDQELMQILEASWADEASARRQRFGSPQKRRMAEAIRAEKLPG